MSESRAENVKCLYCGGPLQGSAFRVEWDCRQKGKACVFAVCSAACKSAAEEYLRRDLKYKRILYGMVMISSIGVIFSALSGKIGLFSYVLQALVGIVFITLPYQVSAYTVFDYNSIRSVVLFSRIAGGIIACGGVVFTLFSL